jgi:Tol biopolymer transport system component
VASPSVAPWTLAYLSSEVLRYPERQLARVDREGHVSLLPSPPRSFYPIVRVSPDGERLAVQIQDLDATTLWVYGLARGTLQPLITEGEAEDPVWSPDGRMVAFMWLKEGVSHLARIRADGSAPAENLLPGLNPSSWSPDGQWLAISPKGDLWMADLHESPPALERVTDTPHPEYSPHFSPDGRWLAYGASDSGRLEVYLQAWPGPGPRHQISIHGGRAPAWNPNGRELFFLQGASLDRMQMMVVDVDLASPVRIGTARALFEFDDNELAFVGFPRLYDVAPDGQSFYVVRTPPGTSSPPPVRHIHLIQGWAEEVKARVPTGK